MVYAGQQEKAEEVCEAVRALGVRAMAVRCDVASDGETKAAVAAVTEELGGVDILVNNAGVTRDGLLFSIKEDDYDKVLDTNLKGAFHMIKHCYRGFLRKKAGRVINISSVSGLMGNAGQANYSASKAGLVGLTKSAARELAGRNICVNAIAPGFIDTDMTAGIPKDNALLAQIPLGHPGKPEDVAGAWRPSWRGLAAATSPARSSVWTAASRSRTQETTSASLGKEQDDETSCSDRTGSRDPYRQ